MWFSGTNCFFSMSEFQFPCIANLDPINFPSSTEIMPLVTQKGPTREATKNNIEGMVDDWRSKLPILSDTKYSIRYKILH